MYLSDLKTGTTVIIDIERKGERFSLTTKVHDNIVDGVLLFAPTSEGAVFSFKSKDVLYLRANTDGKLLRWKAESFKVIPLKGNWYLTFITSKKGQSYNRREAYRVSVGVNSKLKADTSELLDITILDISEVGVGFTSKKELPIDSIVAFSLSSDVGDIPMTVRIVRSAYKEGETLYAYGARILSKDNSRLVKYVTKRQQEELRLRSLQKEM